MRDMKVALFDSSRRLTEFQRVLTQHGVSSTLMTFGNSKWVTHDFADTDILIYYPSFEYSSNYPLALHTVKDNLVFLHERYPHLVMYPDSSLIPYYNDKYRQYLFLRKAGFLVPETVALVSPDEVSSAAHDLGFPLVVKNRFGAGGGYVFLVKTLKELEGLYRASTLDYMTGWGLGYLARQLGQREFWYHLIKEKRSLYPLLSFPLLAQRYLSHEKDLKIVVGDGRTVEMHWRRPARADMWKVNIDGGAVGVWGYVPPEPLAVAKDLAKQLDARWINCDMLFHDGQFYLTEYSPVWHHYKFKEHDDFVYEEAYNADLPLQEGLDLEELIVRSLLKAAGGAE